jgi:hypothetical protein
MRRNGISYIFKETWNLKFLSLEASLNKILFNRTTTTTTTTTTTSTATTAATVTISIYSLKKWKIQIRLKSLLRVHPQEPNSLADDLNCILLLCHKFTLSKYDNNSTLFAGLEFCATWREALWVTCGTPGMDSVYMIFQSLSLFSHC